MIIFVRTIGRSNKLFVFVYYSSTFIPSIEAGIVDTIKLEVALHFKIIPFTIIIYNSRVLDSHHVLSSLFYEYHLPPAPLV